MARFKDRHWINCHDIHYGIIRAFETWSANHQLISFQDVSRDCETDPAVLDCYENFATRCIAANPSDPSGCKPMWAGNCTKLCSTAEIVILAEEWMPKRASETQISNIATTRHYSSLGISHETDVIANRRGPRLTNGDVEARDAIIDKATIIFHPVGGDKGNCMYLDRTYCKGLQDMEARGVSVLVIIGVLIGPLFVISTIMLVIKFTVSLKTLLKRKRGLLLGIRDSIHALTEPIWEVAFLLALVTFGPYSYYEICEPCIACYDFEAAMVHHVGAALGLGAVDWTAHTDKELVSKINSTTCRSDVSRTDIVDLPVGDGSMFKLKAPSMFESAPRAGPVMETPRTKRTNICPTADDIAGLNTLYPTCSGARQPPASADWATPVQEPLCIRSLINLGQMRLFAGVTVGLFVGVLVVSILSKASRFWARLKEAAFAYQKRYETKVQESAVGIQRRWRGHRTRAMVEEASRKGRFSFGEKIRRSIGR